MKTITFSLLLAVMLSSLFIGWIIDKAYTEIYAAPKQQLEKQISLLKLAGQGIASSIDSQNDKLTSLERWQKSDGIELSLMELEEILLPQKLLNELKTGLPLLLENSDGPSFYYFLPTTQQILLLKPDSLTSKNDETIKLVLTIIFYLGTSMLLTLWVYPLAKRLLLLRKAATSFGQGNLDTRVSVGRFGGIRDLEKEFNRMAAQIERLLTDIKLLSGGVSHDLKTPLARLRFGIDALQDESSSASHKYLSRLSDDSDEMIRLVDTMLQYTRLDLAPSSLPTKRLLVEKLIYEATQKFSQATIEIEIDLGSQAIFINGHAVYIEMMLTNLISNAINYAHKRVSLKAKLQNNNVLIVIEDDGEGIAPEYLEDIFKPFFRVPNQASNKGVKHNGLGLAMVKRIIEIHNGSISCTSNDNAKLGPTGTQFTARIPVINE